MDTMATYNDVEAEINSVIAERGVTKASEYRKVIKPLLEKRRRARINNCLSELKDLLVETYKNDITEPSKLEKADILELTVRHLRELRQHRRVVRQTEESDFNTGYAECANEVAACLTKMPGLDNGVRGRLLAHLSKPRVVTPTLVAASNFIRVSPLTPPPSPARSCSTPLSDAESEHGFVHQRTEFSPLPAGYVSLAVLMKHKESNQSPSRSSPMWRPW